jgi:hypothetical protein
MKKRTRKGATNQVGNTTSPVTKCDCRTAKDFPSDLVMGASSVFQLSTTSNLDSGAIAAF